MFRWVYLFGWFKGHMVRDLGGVTSSFAGRRWKIKDLCQAMKYGSLLNRDFMGHLQILNNAQIHLASIIKVFRVFFVSSSFL